MHSPVWGDSLQDTQLSCIIKYSQRPSGAFRPGCTLESLTEPLRKTDAGLTIGSDSVGVLEALESVLVRKLPSFEYSSGFCRALLPQNKWVNLKKQDQCNRPPK